LGQDYGSFQFLRLTELEQQLHSALDASPNSLLLDLSETTCFGGSFLSVLLRCYTRSNNNNCRFALCTIQKIPASVASVTRLSSIWQIFQSRREAIESLQRRFENDLAGVPLLNE